MSRSERRGITSGTLIVVVAAAALLVAAGYLVGRGIGASGDEPAAPPAGSPPSPAGPARDAPLEPALPAPQARPVPLTLQPAAAPPGWKGLDEEESIDPVLKTPPPNAAADPEAPFRFEPPLVDFGTVALDVDLEDTVRIRNVSSAPLTIEAMKPDCKCTTVEDLTGTVIPPRGFVDFRVRLSGRSVPGAKSSKVRFIFADYGPAFVEIKCVASRAVMATPGYFVAIGELEGAYTLNSVDGRPFRVLAVNGGAPQYVDGFEPARDAPRSEYRLKWSLLGYDPATCRDSQGRPMPWWWVIETDHPDAPVVDVRIRHHCVRVEPPPNGRPWILSEQRVVIGQLEPGESTEFEVSLQWLRGGRPSDTIQSVRSESPQFTATLLEVRREGDEITCRVRITPAADHRGLIYGGVRFQAYTQLHSEALTIIGRVAENGE